MVDVGSNACFDVSSDFIPICFGRTVQLHAVGKRFFFGETQDLVVRLQHGFEHGDHGLVVCDTGTTDLANLIRIITGAIYGVNDDSSEVAAVLLVLHVVFRHQTLKKEGESTELRIGCNTILYDRSGLFRVILRISLERFLDGVIRTVEPSTQHIVVSFDDVGRFQNRFVNALVIRLDVPMNRICNQVIALNAQVILKARRHRTRPHLCFGQRAVVATSNKGIKLLLIDASLFEVFVDVVFDGLGQLAEVDEHAFAVFDFSLVQILDDRY